MSSYQRVTVDMAGILQGVGFRPTMARLARGAGVGGWVRNQSGTVRLCLEGEVGQLERFLEELPKGLPPAARLTKLTVVERRDVPLLAPEVRFEIRESAATDRPHVSIPADLALCVDCRAEVADPSSRFYRYPFTTCTNCGPRYTVVDSMPYDRERTALRAFPLCAECRKQYEDPGDRRFHAESIACPTCGPRLSLLAPNGQRILGDPLLEARAALARGQILAVRGLGGFLLAVDAFNEAAVGLLRQRKARPHKPLAVMARNLEVIRRLCQPSDAECALLTSSQAPIVILDLPEHRARVPEALSPGTNNLGFMLPTTPLHLLLFEQLEGDPLASFDLLVMTSGNKGGEPICIHNDEALERLCGIADLFLVHDREIHLRCDDSLVACSTLGPQILRRARGYAPQTISVSRPFERCVMAMGAELKNTLCLAYDDEAVLSPHIGDLETPQAVDALQLVSSRLPEFFCREPQVVAVDLHPDMHSTRLGVAYARQRGLDVVEVQHHVAHAAAVMGEHGVARSLALVCDGTGLGTDGSIWGCELLCVEPSSWKRLGTLAKAPLPGGDTATLHPGKQLVARCLAAALPVPAALLSRLGATQAELETWKLQISRSINCPWSHAAGRLFDSLSALLGACPPRITFEGQAAIWLEAIARRAPAADLGGNPYCLERRDNLWTVDFSPLLVDLLEHPVDPADRGGVARGFHEAFAKSLCELATRGRDETGIDTVALGGGVMMNRLLVTSLARRLVDEGLKVLLPRDVPINDGGVSFGQAVFAGGAL
jgi:hydrogenase maturation protein HypF